LLARGRAARPPAPEAEALPRLFTAIEIPETMRLRLSLLRAPISGAKWVQPEDMHITLRFAGDIDGRTADDLADLLAEVSVPPFMVSINAGEAPISWRATAKDGYPLQASQATNRPAVLIFDPGEIYDFEYTPAAAGDLVLKFGVPPFLIPPPPPPGAPPAPQPPPTISVPIHVR